MLDRLVLHGKHLPLCVRNVMTRTCAADECCYLLQSGTLRHMARCYLVVAIA